jgi:hypothetical protein
VTGRRGGPVPWSTDGKVFTRREVNIIRRHDTPAKVQRFLNSLTYNDDKIESMKSFRQVVRTGRAHCLEAVMVAGTILLHHGYPPLVLDLESKGDPDHVVYIYKSKRTGLWGAIGKSRDPGLEGRKPVFRTIRALVYSYYDPFIDFDARIMGYGVANLLDLDSDIWMFSERSVWEVESHLNHIPHKPLRSSEERYQFWYKRFIRYKKRFPDRSPLYYNNRRTWTPGFKRKKR